MVITTFEGNKFVYREESDPIDCEFYVFQIVYFYGYPFLQI